MSSPINRQGTEGLPYIKIFANSSDYFNNAPREISLRTFESLEQQEGEEAYNLDCTRAMLLKTTQI